MKMELKWTLVLAAIVAVTIIAVIFLRPKPDFSNMRIGYLPISASLPAYVAIERGYFQELNLEPELIKFTNSNTMMTALLAGEIDIAASPSAVDVLASALKFSGKFKVFRVGYTTVKDYVSAVIVKKDAPYQNLTELVGKKIAVFPGSTMSMYARLIFQKSVGSFAEVQLVPMPPSSQLQALASGSVDACLILEPTGIIGEQKGISRYLERAVVEKYIFDPWVAGFSVISQAYIDTQPENAQKAVEAFNLGITDLRKDPASGATYLTKYNNLPEDVARKVPVPISWMSGEFPSAEIQKLVKLLLREGVLEKEPNMESIVYKD